MANILENKNYKLIQKVLIANQGEIAVRIIRACQELNIKTVAIYSVLEKDELHVKLADEAICIGPGPLLKSYMHIPSIIQAAVSIGAHAIHPGYGMLSENVEFARTVEKAGIIWIGPKSDVIEKLGNKIIAREIAKKAGIPLAKGSPKLKNKLDTIKWAKKIGYPVILKAANGGGGKGIVIVKKAKNIEQAFETVLGVSKMLYNNSDIFIEKYIENPRHIEVQIIADKFGNVIHLLERDCTLQRNNQKLIEEAPSVFITENTRKNITKAAIKLAKATDYSYVGTVEFLVDTKQNFYFMEMNPRIQVEHPITEEITGIDIVKEQLLIAGGKKITLDQKEIKANAHSIEIRINAEDPCNNFTPTGGKIEFLHVPNGKGVRWESALYNGLTLSTFTDSTIAKLIATSKTREGAILKLKRAIEELIITGVKTNIHFQHNLLLSNEFLKCKHTTKFVEEIFLPRYLKKIQK